MNNRIPAIILSDDVKLQELLSLYIKDDVLFEPVCADCSANIDEILFSSGKSVLIVDMKRNFSELVNKIFDVSKNYSDCKIIALIEDFTVDSIVEIMRAGAKDVLSVPVIKSEFLEVLSGVKDSIDNTEEKETRCSVISIFSNKGGIGKTSIASNLALELAEVTKEKVALIDLNFQMGDVTTFMDLNPSLNLSYVLQNLDKINEEFLLGTLEKYSNTSLYVLADPPFFKQAESISEKQISKLISLLRDTFSYIVIDAESSFDGKNISALSDSDYIFLITIANLPALRNSQRCLELFDRLGFAENKVQILLNRYMENDEVSENDVEEVLGRKIFWKIPNNYFTMMSAINKGVPVCMANPNSNVSKSYRSLAMRLSDRIFREETINKYKNYTGGNVGLK